MPLPLAPDETALIAMLQNIQDHLEQELQSLNAQVERKTVQMQGIRSILEDVRNGSGVSSVAVLEASLVPEANGSLAGHAAIVEPAIAAPLSDPGTDENGLVGVIAESSPNDPPVIATTPNPAPAQPSRAKSPDRKSSKPSKVTAPTTTSKSKSVGISDLRSFMASEYQGLAVSVAVGKILAESKQAMSSGDIATELYEGLSKADFSRVKLALLTVLSKGKTSGLWQSVGKGLYARN